LRFGDAWRFRDNATSGVIGGDCDGSRQCWLGRGFAGTFAPSVRSRPKRATKAGIRKGRDQRVEQEADEEHGANLTEALDRDQHHGREGDGEDQPGDRDRSLGARPGAAYRGFSGPSAAALQIRLIGKTL
jgi:hypothetical protein